MEPRLVFDESAALSLRAERCQVQASRDEVALLFGDAGTQARRILMPPLAAKRLLGAVARLVAEQAVPAGALPLLALVRAVDERFGIERSAKFSPGAVNAERVILALRALPERRAAIAALCRSIGMAEGALAGLVAQLPDANVFGIGFEDADGEGPVLRAYLEFWERLKARVQREPANREPALLYVGYKWQPRRPEQVRLARYLCHPLLDAGGITARLEALYRDASEAPSCALAAELLRLAATRVPGGGFVYVEVEEGSARRSFDLNFYKAGITVGDAAPLLLQLGERYGIARGRIEALCAEADACTLGHLSGGRGTDGRDFATVYYEIEGI